MENLMKLWQVRERNFHKLGQQKAYWQVSIMHQKVGIQTTRFGRSKNAPPFETSYKLWVTRNTRLKKILLSPTLIRIQEKIAVDVCTVIEGIKQTTLRGHLNS